MSNDTKTKKMICLGCPNGCHLTVACDDNNALTIEGAKCERGEAYAQEEYFEPKRVVTAVVRTTSVETPYIPVKSTKPVLIALIPDLLATIYSLEISPPKKCGDLILEDFQNTGVDIAITRTMHP